MAPARLRLQYRILLPFALVALAASVATALVTLRVTSATIEARAEAQILNAARLLSGGGFATSPVILGSVKAITGADVVTYQSSGQVLASTLSAGESAGILRALASSVQPHGPSGLRHIDCGGACYVATGVVSAGADLHVAVIMRGEALSAGTEVVTRQVVLVVFIGLVAMVLVSQLVARRVTAPLDALVRFAREVSPEGTNERAPTGPDEVGRLGGAFNDMLDRIEESREALVRSEKLGLAGLFAARVAHDVRNPLSSIKMQTQLLRMRLSDVGDGQGVAALDGVQRDITQVESVIRDLLELARPGELRREPTSINAIVQATLDQLGPQLTYRKICVAQHLSPEVPVVPLDGRRFQQALLNVVNNAADAMPTGGDLELATRCDGDLVQVSVADDGVGVDPALLSRIFDPFVSSKRDGVGLGLVNVKAVVEQHGGTIAIAPRSPRGTLVTISIPGPIHG